MESGKFDEMSRSLAARADRRKALAGAGGLLAAVAGGLGFGARNASAATPAAPVNCTLPLLATVAAGKNKGKHYNGDLAITIETSGAIDSGQLTTPDGGSFDVVGQASGRSLNLRVKIGTNLFLSLIGTGQQDLALCRGRVDGTFGGSAESDLGTWTLGVKPTASTPTPASAATTAAGNGGNAGGNSGAGNGTSSNPGPTNTPCPAQDCGGGPFVWLPDRCACGCNPPTVKCGDTMCCPAGSVCDAAGGSCTCPSGTTFCIDSCVPNCANGLNYTTCRCASQTDCGANETLCNGSCILITCVFEDFDQTTCTCKNPCPSGQALCGGVCISITTNNHCGSCGNVCPTGQSCFGNYCGCPPDYTYNPAKMKCFPPCATACVNGTTCQDGLCKPV